MTKNDDRKFHHKVPVGAGDDLMAGGAKSPDVPSEIGMHSPRNARADILAEKSPEPITKLVK